MKHVDWLDPDKLVINNSDINKPFLNDVASGQFKNLRLLFVNNSFINIKNNLFMRYEINGNIKWYGVQIIDKRSDIYYLNISNIFSNLDLTEKLENQYKEFNREDILNKILK